MPIGKVKISACIITFNEEKNVRECLESVSWADEIVVVDSFSADATVQICRQYTDRVVQHPWEGHVAQKNVALNLATHDWVMCIDADERISDALREQIHRELQKSPVPCDGYFFPRRTFYLGRWIKHGGWYPDYKLRLFRKSKGRWGGVDPHDEVMLDGTAQYLSAPLDHVTYRNIAHHVATINAYTDISAEQKIRAHAKFPRFHLLLNPVAKFFTMYFLRGGFLDGVPGFIVAASGSFYVFLKYAKLWEKRALLASKETK